MMRSVKVMLLLAAAVCAFASAAASASAAEWFVGGKALGAGNKKNIASAVTVIKHPILKAESIEITVECEEIVAKEGEIEGLNKGEVKSLEFKECKVTHPTGCELVGNEIKTKPVSATPTTGTAPADFITFAPVTPKIFTEPVFKGTCGGGIEGKTPIKGTCKVEAPGGQTEKVKQKVVANCKKELEIGANKAEFTGEFEIELETKEAFSYH